MVQKYYFKPEILLRKTQCIKESDSIRWTKIRPKSSPPISPVFLAVICLKWWTEGKKKSPIVIDYQGFTLFFILFQ